MTNSTSAARRAGRVIAGAVVAVLLAVAVTVAVSPDLVSKLFNAQAASSAPPVTVVSGPPAAASIPLPDTSGQAAQAAAAASAGSTPMTALPADGSRYFGVSVTDVTPGADPSADFTAAVGVAPTLQMFFGSFAGTFDVSAARAITSAGRLPLYTWEPFDNRNRNADAFPLTAIAAGKYDTYLRGEAARFASVRGPLVIRFAHEMNGNWYPWGAGVPGNSPAAYVAAYRHVHDVVTAAGASNVVWMWAPNLIDADPSIALGPLYPGDSYVDWVGLSGYYSTAADTFASRMSPTLTEINRVAPTKPIMLAETAVDRTPDRAAQITDLVAGVTHTPRFIGFVWFDVAKRADWSVSDDPAAASALGQAVSAGGFGARPQTVKVPVAPNR